MSLVARQLVLLLTLFLIATAMMAVSIFDILDQAEKLNGLDDAVSMLAAALILMFLAGVASLVLFSGYWRKNRHHVLRKGFSWDHVNGLVLHINSKQQILDANPQFEQLFGLRKGQSLNQLQAGDEQQEVAKQLRHALTTQSMVQFEVSLLDQADEWTRWSVVARPWQNDEHRAGKGQTDCLLLTADDISMRFFAEEQLREERQRLSTYIDTMQTLLIVCNQDGLVLHTNPEAQKRLQLPEHQIKGYPLTYLLPSHASAILNQQWQNLLSRASGSLTTEFPLITSTGKQHIIRWRMTVLKLSGQTQVLLAGLDISEDVANKEALESANIKIREALAQAEQANRSKSVFLANMSHEIRTPMNGILGASELALDTELDEDQRHYLDIIHSSSHALLDILNDILDLSKIESGKLELEQIEFDLDTLLTELHALFREPARRKGLDLVYLYSGELPVFWLGDPKRIRQIITNLISNAMKFTEQGRISIRVDGQLDDKGQQQLNIAVTDTGIGIPPDKQQQIFSAFRQADSSTSRRFGGTGLGLTICRYLARAMQGEVSLHSVQGEGSTFTLSIPLTAAQHQQSSAMAAEAKRHARLKGSVLLAEDNDVNRRVAVKMLEKLGLHCTVAEDGLAAVQAVQSQHFDLVLMDINMPVMDGITATRRIRESDMPNNNLPILALTANAMMEDRQRCLQAGMNGFISKPIKVDALRIAIAEALPRLTFN